MDKKMLRIVGAVAILGVGYFIYQRIRKNGTTTILPGSGSSGPQIGDGNLPSGTSDPTFVPCDPVPMDFGCSSVYNDACGKINFTNPEANTECCGEMVYKFQCALNQYQAFGIEEDGKYGSQTLQAHQTIRSQAAIPPDFPGVSFSF